MKITEFRKLIREEVRKVLKENNEEFLDAVFNTINDELRTNMISKKDFEKMKAYLETEEDEIVSKFLGNGEDDVEQAVDFIRQQALKLNTSR